MERRLQHCSSANTGRWASSSFVTLSSDPSPSLGGGAPRSRWSWKINTHLCSADLFHVLRISSLGVWLCYFKIPQGSGLRMGKSLTLLAVRRQVLHAGSSEWMPGKRRGLANRPQSPRELLSHPPGEDLRLGVCVPLCECASPTVGTWQGFGANYLGPVQTKAVVMVRHLGEWWRQTKGLLGVPGECLG